MMVNVAPLNKAAGDFAGEETWLNWGGWAPQDSYENYIPPYNLNRVKKGGKIFTLQRRFTRVALVG